MENDSTRLEMMVDIETLGLKPGSVVASIGAVVFDAQGNHADRFYTRIDLQAQLEAGLMVDASTIQWWMRQSDEARKAAFGYENLHPSVAIGKFADFVQENRPEAVWAKGPQFDITLLECLFDAFNRPAPWSYRAIRDLRTMLVAADKVLDASASTGTAHHALDDAAFQVAELIDCRKIIDGTL